MKKWDGKRRGPIYLFIGSFLGYLVDHNLKEIQDRQKQFSKYIHRNINNSPIVNNTTIPWIQNILQTPISDSRKYVIRTIIVPYLVTIKRLDPTKVLKS
jgi:hypothetical protein